MGKLHCLDVGFGDTSVILANSELFLVDCYNEDVLDNYLYDKSYIHAVFITHQHYDHFRGLRYLIGNDIEVGFLIYSPYSRRYNDNSVEYEEWQEFNRYIKYFKDKGTKLYTPYRQNNFDKPWWQPAGLSIWMLGPNKLIANSETREIHECYLGANLFLSRGKSLISPLFPPFT